jgi:signal transduction protein with GAF and PtsI domain
MSTLLEKYQAMKNGFDAGLSAAMPSPSQIWQHQEALYRIAALETFQSFVRTVPKSADMKVLLTHYQMVDAYIQNLTQERCGGNGVSEDIHKQRETAHASLEKVVQDYRRRFGSFAPGSDTQFQTDIRNVISAVVPVWIQYRNTYVAI